MLTRESRFHGRFRQLLFFLIHHPFTSPSNMAAGSLETSQTPLYNYVLGFLAVGLAWGFTTPFMRKAAIISKPISRPQLDDPTSSIVTKRFLSIWYAVYDLVVRPAYSIPLILNLSGSVWFFLLVGQAGMLRFNLIMRRSSNQWHRAESYGSNHEFACVLIHSTWGMVR
jgi:Putative transmembrane family 234